MRQQLPRRILTVPFVALSGDDANLSGAARRAQESLESTLQKSGRYRLLPDGVTLPPDWHPGIVYDANRLILQKAVGYRRKDADYVLAGMLQPLERRDGGRALRTRLDVFLYEIITVHLMDAFRAVGEARVQGEPPIDAIISETVGRSVQKAARRLETLRLARARIQELDNKGSVDYWATMDCGDCRKAGFAKGLEAIVKRGPDVMGRVHILRVEGDRLNVTPLDGTRVGRDFELLACLPSGTLTLPEL